MIRNEWGVYFYVREDLLEMVRFQDLVTCLATDFDIYSSRERIYKKR